MTTPHTPAEKERTLTDERDLPALSVREFVSATAAKTPTPGGGSVAGVVGALGVALGEMALNFTKGKKKYAEHEDFYGRLAGRFAIARGMFLDLIADDVAAFGLYQDATRKDDGPEKDQAVQLATAAAIDVPREMTKIALALLSDLVELSDKCNPYLVTDLLAAAALAVAVVRLSDYNVRINAPQLSDASESDGIRRSSAEDLKRAMELAGRIETTGAAQLD